MTTLKLECALNYIKYEASINELELMEKRLSEALLAQKKKLQLLAKSTKTEMLDKLYDRLDDKSIIGDIDKSIDIIKSPRPLKIMTKSSFSYDVYDIGVVFFIAGPIMEDQYRFRLFDKHGDDPDNDSLEIHDIHDASKCRVHMKRDGSSGGCVRDGCSQFDFILKNPDAIKQVLYYVSCLEQFYAECRQLKQNRLQ